MQKALRTSRCPKSWSRCPKPITLRGPKVCIAPKTSSVRSPAKGEKDHSKPRHLIDLYLAGFSEKTSAAQRQAALSPAQTIQDCYLDQGHLWKGPSPYLTIFHPLPRGVKSTIGQPPRGGAGVCTVTDLEIRLRPPMSGASPPTS